MAALDFPASPTVGQQYAAPNGVTYQWDGAAWVVTGGVPATPTGPAGGDLTGTYPNPTLAHGATLKSPPAATYTGTTNVGTTEVVVCEASPTLAANAQAVVLAFLYGWQQFQIAGGPQDSTLTVNLRRGGTTGTVSGTVLTTDTIANTYSAQWQRFPFSVLLTDVYAPAATGAVRYAITVVNSVAGAGNPMANSLSGMVRVLPFS